MSSTTPPTVDSGAHLDILGMFHYAIGAMMGMVALLPALYLFVNLSLTDPSYDPAIRLAAEQSVASATFVFAVIALAAGIVGGALVAWGGYCMQHRTHFRICRASAFVACLFLPLGTLLGIASLSQLSRRDVRKLFLESGG
jgi:heme A synthase